MVEPFRNGLARQVWSVAALVQAASDALAARFSACTVQGEISGFSRAASGHCYFSLKDADGAAVLLRCAMFRRAASLLDFAPQDGQCVELRGRLAVYEPRGELQFVVEAMQRAGAGSLYEQFLRLKAKLEAQGLFDADRKRPIAAHPACIGIVTSLGAAALHDVLTTLARRSPQVRVIVYPSPVQGADAPVALAAALVLAGKRAEVDTLILCRGGGALEDLWAFNDEHLVRAIAASPIPVICGVGHETDVTLADFAADLRAPTPTAAAELCAPARDGLRAAVAAFAQALARGAERHTQAAAQRLDRLALHMRRPGDLALRERLRLQGLTRSLARAIDTALARRGAALLASAAELRHGLAMQRTQAAHRVQNLATRLAACDPERIVARGYALVQTIDGDLVTDPRRLRAGDTLRLSLAQGHAEVDLAQVRPE